MDLTNPALIPLAGIIFGTVGIVVIVVVAIWFGAHEKELRAHQELRLREMDHQLKMKQLELEIEKTRSQRVPETVA